MELWRPVDPCRHSDLHRRGELYGGEFITAYSHLTGMRGTESLEQTLDEYRIEWTLLDKDWAANKLLAHLPGWRQAYSDDQATIFVRR